MPKNDPVVKTIKHARSLSLRKWHKARKDLEALLSLTSQPCGFCFFADLHTGCEDCPASIKCVEMSIEVNAFLEGSLTYIEEDLIPWIVALQLNGEAS